MRVRFLKEWQDDKGHTFAKDAIDDLDEDLAWTLAMQGIVKFKKTPDPEMEKLKQEAKQNRKRNG